VKDEFEAVKLYRMSSDQGHAGGQCYLGVCYQFGVGGLSKDLEEAKRLYRLAADQGDEYAIRALTNM
jgi:TPR repeat protein